MLCWPVLTGRFAFPSSLCRLGILPSSHIGAAITLQETRWNEHTRSDVTAITFCIIRHFSHLLVSHMLRNLDSISFCRIALPRQDDPSSPILSCNHQLNRPQAFFSPSETHRTSPSHKCSGLRRPPLSLLSITACSYVHACLFRVILQPSPHLRPRDELKGSLFPSLSISPGTKLVPTAVGSREDSLDDHPTIPQGSALLMSNPLVWVSFPSLLHPDRLLRHHPPHPSRQMVVLTANNNSFGTHA
jgi:hypothetical protein